MTAAHPLEASFSSRLDPRVPRDRPAEHPRTPGFIEHAHTTEFRIAAHWTHAWRWLETPETFSEGQIWPYRVDFLAPEPGSPAGFHEGGLNIHHGPLLSLPGRLDTIEETQDGAYRSLSYFYGSYVLSLRLLRPTRLEFLVLGEGDAETRVRLRLSSDVVPWAEKPWSRMQEVFWSRLGSWMARSIGAARLG